QSIILGYTALIALSVKERCDAGRHAHQGSQHGTAAIASQYDFSSGWPACQCGDPLGLITAEARFGHGGIGRKPGSRIASMHRIQIGSMVHQIESWQESKILA